MTYGINVQAVCDADSRFIYFGVIAPGKCSDQVAFERTSIFDRVAAFNTGFYLVGDAAYTLSDVMLVPFVGSQRDDPTQDTFNFLLFLFTAEDKNRNGIWSSSDKMVCSEKT